MWIITREINEYRQDGEYFFAAYSRQPTLTQLALLFYDKSIDELTDDEILFITSVKRGGGQDACYPDGNGNEWFTLHNVEEGKRFK